MNKGLLLSAFSLVAVFGVVTMAGAGSVDWQYFTHAPDVGNGPGADLLMGTVDDAPDPINTAGAYSVTSAEYDPLDPQCPQTSVTYMTGIVVDCLGTPPGQFTATYLNVAQGEPIPGAGAVYSKLTAGGGPNTGNACGLGVFQSTTDTTMYMAGLPLLPMEDTPLDGKVFDATIAVTAPYTCLTTTYSAAYLESVRQKLPGGATAFIVACSSIDFGPLPAVPCLNNAVMAATLIQWTDDPLDCDSICCDDDGDDVDGPKCGGDDCDDSDPEKPPCGGSCAGGPAG
jgi:hypothetical protein